MKLSRRQLRKLILEELGPDRMEKPDDGDINLAEITKAENEFNLFYLANLIQKGSVGKPNVYHVGNLSSGKVYLDFGDGPFVEVMIKPISNRDEIKSQSDYSKPVEGKIGTY